MSIPLGGFCIASRGEYRLISLACGTEIRTLSLANAERAKGFEDRLCFNLMEDTMQRNGRTTRQTMALVAALVLAAFFANQIGLFQTTSVKAAIETGVKVTISSTASGSKTFDASGNSLSANDWLVLPGEQVSISTQFTTQNISDRAHVREDASVLSTDVTTTTAPIVWGWASAQQPYVLGIFPQDGTGADLASPIYVRVYSVNPTASAIPNIVVAGGPAVSINPSFTPIDTKFFVFNPGFGPDLAETTNAGATVTYTVPGKYQPSVKFLNAAHQIIATATSNFVYVSMPVTTITPNNSTQAENSIVEFRVPEYASFFSPTTPPANPAVVGTLPDGTIFNSRLATANGDQSRADTVAWKVTQTGVIGVSVQADGIEIGTATTSVTMQATPPPTITPPTYTVTPDPIWTVGMTGTLSIFVSNPPANAANMAINVSVLGYNQYNVWQGGTHTTMPDGRIRVDTAYNFSEVGPRTFTIQLDYVDNGVWKHADPTTATINVQPKASATITGAKSYHVSEAMSFCAVLSNLTLQSTDEVLWVGPWGSYNTRTQSNPLCISKFQTTPWTGTIEFRVQRGNSNIVDVFYDNVTAGIMWGVYLPLIARPAPEVHLTASNANPTAGQNVAQIRIDDSQYVPQRDDEVIWRGLQLPNGGSEYNTGLAVRNGGQADARILLDTSFTKDTTVTVEVQRGGKTIFQGNIKIDVR